MPKTWETNKIAGEEWMRSFVRRNPILSLRTPEGCSLARAISFNEHDVNKFFENLYNAINRHERFCDRTRKRDYDCSKIRKAAKVNKVTSGERRVLVTTCVIINAAGNHLPPAMIFPRVHFKDHGTLGLTDHIQHLIKQFSIE
ncbi:hypothetical protein MML48_3g00013779 [Holotrichia oblita]|uniref:Uncharacterized protein n=1 Tax=Holotrichia oblita TaxID=644536 RepID=A0ACB9THY3_HOLOL|nr:hypothetical protein MML48_3g00013779 [Holotrichia oblita]